MADKKEAAPEQAAAEGEEGGEKKGSNLPLVLGIIAGVLVLQTVIVILVVSSLFKPPVDPEEAAKKAAQDSLDAIIAKATGMGTVTEPIEAIVNIAGTDGERFLKAIIILEYQDDKKGTFGLELMSRAPRFKDLMINHLSALTLTEITEPGAKDKIRKDLLRQINSTLPNNLGEVQDVLFTTFIIQ
ncbi:MAG: flagellar basal body-associated FliL family protein [Chitinispirillia bacterium]|nr:flagellar basal body-associated FliL family protein [Chitinispirillia bacterium]MCL2268640.1 flagellar basal body-associated FliL family protein [Chitinispirillia bacterium]